MQIVILIILFFSSCIWIRAQEGKTYLVRSIVFYNVENLFDIHNDTLTFDDDRTPSGKDQWTEERYMRKLFNISKVLSEVGEKETGSAPDIVGLCEVENKLVLDDLVNHPHLRENEYGIVHFDSPDERGIDVALLYKKSVFLPTSFASRKIGR